MDGERVVSEGRLRRLVEDLAEDAFDLEGPADWKRILVAEMDYALRPPVHERRIPSYGAIVEPGIDPSRWEEPTHLGMTHRRIDASQRSGIRRFADGLTSWVVVRAGQEDEIVVFDRPSGSERDLVILSEAMGATLVQRHPSGTVRVVGDFGVLRWDRIRWHHEPPVRAWIDSVKVCEGYGDQEVLEILLEFAVHDLGSRGIGAILVYRPDDAPDLPFQVRLPTPPPLQVTRPTDLGPLRHVLAQVDGAAVFDRTGTLRQLGVRLVPSPVAENEVDGFRGMRHTSGRRYSFDDAAATVIVVSEDGPVTVLRNGEILAASVGAHSSALSPETERESE